MLLKPPGGGLPLGSRGAGAYFLYSNGPAIVHCWAQTRENESHTLALWLQRAICDPQLTNWGSQVYQTSELIFRLWFCRTQKTKCTHGVIFVAWGCSCIANITVSSLPVFLLFTGNPLSWTNSLTRWVISKCPCCCTSLWLQPVLQFRVQHVCFVTGSFIVIKLWVRVVPPNWFQL